MLSFNIYIFPLAAQFDTALEYNKDLETQLSTTVFEFLNPSQVLDLFERVNIIDNFQKDFVVNFILCAVYGMEVLCICWLLFLLQLLVDIFITFSTLVISRGLEVKFND